MSNKQLAVLWIGIVLIVLMCLFPPWVIFREGFAYGKGRHRMSLRTSLGYRCLIWPPKAKVIKDEPWNSYGRYHLDISRLIVQCVAVALLTTVGIYTLRPKQRTDG